MVVVDAAILAHDVQVVEELVGRQVVARLAYEALLDEGEVDRSLDDRICSATCARGDELVVRRSVHKRTAQNAHTFNTIPQAMTRDARHTHAALAMR